MKEHDCCEEPDMCVCRESYEQANSNSALSGGLASLAKYRLVELDDGYWGIYLKDYNVRCATIHQGNLDLVQTLNALMAG